VIEDSLTGMRAGRAAGMTVWRFTGGSHMAPDLPEPDDARPHLVCKLSADFLRRIALMARKPCHEPRRWPETNLQDEAARAGGFTMSAG
jgi:hypothetical protein